MCVIAVQFMFIFAFDFLMGLMDLILTFLIPKRVIGVKLNLNLSIDALTYDRRMSNKEQMQEYRHHYEH
jgi:hypothetical protein